MGFRQVPPFPNEKEWVGLQLERHPGHSGGLGGLGTGVERAAGSLAQGRGEGGRGTGEGLGRSRTEALENAGFLLLCS